MSDRRVLLVTGWGRSGSTLLDRALGEVPGIVSTGEIREIWERGLKENRPCGCDEPFRSCPFWTQVGKSAFGGWDEIDLDDILRLRFGLDRPWMVPAIVSRRRGGSLERRIVRYRGLLSALYRGILEASGADLVVDSSKMPSHGFLVRGMPEVDLRTVHLVRDSRGVAWSWQRRVEKKVTEGAPALLPRYSPAAAAVRWLVYNAQASSLGRGIPSMRLRYEDLVAEPRGSIAAILRLAGMEPTEEGLAFVGERELTLGVSHTADGNPMRFALGSVPLRADEEWRTAMPASQRRLVTALTAPGLARYGYGLVAR